MLDSDCERPNATVNGSLTLTIDTSIRAVAMNSFSYFMVGGLLLMGLLVLLWRPWFAGFLVVVAVVARVGLTWTGYMFHPGRIRFLDAFLALVVLLVAARLWTVRARRSAARTRREAQEASTAEGRDPDALPNSATSTDAVGYATAVLALPLAVFALLQSLLPAVPSQNTLSACDGASISGSNFLGRTGESGLNARSGPSTTFELQSRYAANCLMGFDDYCVGEGVKDELVPALSDVRWLRVHHTDTFVAAGAVFALDPPTDLGTEPSEDCPLKLANPHLAEATDVRADGDSFTITAHPENTAFVGFALRYETADGHVKIEQLGTTPKTTNSQGDVVVTLDLNGFDDSDPVAGDVILSVVPCLAPIVPSPSETQLYRFDPESGSHSAAPSLPDAEEMARLTQSGCRLDPMQNNGVYAEDMKRGYK